MRTSLTGNPARIAAVICAAIVYGCAPSPTYVTVPVPLKGMNVDSLRTAWSRLPLDSTHSAMRDGKNCNCKVSVTIAGIKGNQTFDPNHPPLTPQAVAHVVNNGTIETAMYGFKPDNDAYFVVVADSANNPVWSLVQIPRHSAGVVSVQQGKGVDGCKPFHLPKGSDANFQNCTTAHSLHGTNSLLRLASLGMRWLPGIARLTGEDPVWVTCSAGCCTMEPN